MGFFRTDETLKYINSKISFKTYNHFFQIHIYLSAVFLGAKFHCFSPLWDFFMLFYYLVPDVHVQSIVAGFGCNLGYVANGIQMFYLAVKMKLNATDEN